ncbi:hypothetical protein FHS18_005528 [Paenibacillus phyllosphaerae]|uniref:Uncharacterized protein n=1 Tax=Paenibacillus phyllosphaerae TaxID=274593 RepID=A0A7W5B3S9_9BACL|nr:hypothetical protein [Paenibacillus phyllosphaerae]MBB3113416.1 hypothetical protein [Paenibacillus phyllosphaerae]
MDYKVHSVSKTFYEDSLQVIGIYQRMIDEIDTYKPDERMLVHSFDARNYPGIEDMLLKKRIIKYKVRYMAKYLTIARKKEEGPSIRRELLLELEGIKEHLANVIVADDH